MVIDHLQDVAPIGPPISLCDATHLLGGGLPAPVEMLPEQDQDTAGKTGDVPCRD